jgi:hypothetical protein
MPGAMKRSAWAGGIARKRGALAALALTPLLSGCLAAVALPLVAGGGLARVASHRVRAATPTSTPATNPRHRSEKGHKDSAPGAAETRVPVPLEVLPSPSVAPPSAEDPWQKFFAYAVAQRSAADSAKPLQSAVLVDNPTLDAPHRRPCSKSYPAVVIDLDGLSAPFAPERLTAPAGVADGLARLRDQGIVVLWISQLPATRAADVAHALQAAGLDPKRQDQLLLIRHPDDRKQLLRESASDDVCIVAIAGDKRDDFDELFDYLRNPEAAAGLSTMMGEGWFLVPPIDGAAA